MRADYIEQPHDLEENGRVLVREREILTTASAGMPIKVPTVKDYEERASDIIPGPLFRVTLGHEDSTTKNNLQAFTRVKFRPRVLVDVSRRRQGTAALGQPISFPVMIAPAGTNMRVHPDGELASARAAGDAGTLFVLSHAASYSIEEVARVATGPLWFQVYALRDREVVARAVRRAEAAGYKAIVLTVDHPGVRSREREDQFSQTITALRRLGNLDDFARQRLGIADQPLAIWNAIKWHDPSLSWKDLEWFRSLTSLPLIVKGIQFGDDALRCVDAGVAGLIVSNHGGHQLPDARGTLEVLPEVVRAVGDRLEVYLDGGVRTGADVLKSLALGAKGVFIGRPVFWGLSVDGELGVRRILAILRHELDTVMAYCGVTDVNAIDPDLIASAASDSGASVVEDLCRLADLHKKGYLSRVEFDAAKARVLAALR
jgi:4-hydroxymandelate oxidase